MKETESILTGDVVIFYQNTLPVDFYHIVNILPDTVKRDFWSVTFMKIGMPTIIFSFLLDTDQLNGGDFTMNGVPCRLQLYSRPMKVEVKKQHTIEEVNNKLDNLVKEEDSLL